MVRFRLKPLVLCIALASACASRAWAAPVQEATTTTNGAIAFSADCTTGDLVTLYIGDTTAGPPTGINADFATASWAADWMGVAAVTEASLAGGWLFAIQCAQPGKS